MVKPKYNSKWSSPTSVTRGSSKGVMLFAIASLSSKDHNIKYKGCDTWKRLIDNSNGIINAIFNIVMEGRKFNRVHDMHAKKQFGQFKIKTLKLMVNGEDEILFFRWKNKVIKWIYFSCPSINHQAWNIPLATNHWILFKVIKHWLFFKTIKLGSFHWPPSWGPFFVSFFFILFKRFGLWSFCFFYFWFWKLNFEIFIH